MSSSSLVKIERDRHIRRSGNDYYYPFMSLFPQGQAWPREPDSTHALVIRGLSQIWGFVDERAAHLLEMESDPRQTVEILPEWEKAWGLPDDCITEPLTIADRQRFLVLWMTYLGGQSRQFFSDALKLIEYTVSAEEFREWSPFMVGISQVGDTRNLNDVLVDEDGNPYVYRWEIGAPEMRFYWSVKVGGVRINWFRCGWHGSECGIDPHCRIAAATDLQCLLQRWKPAHTEVLLDYSGLGPPDPMAGTP